MKNLLLILLLAVLFTACKKESTIVEQDIKHIIDINYNGTIERVYIVSEIDYLPNGCIRYMQVDKLHKDQVYTSTNCNPYVLIK